jgi:hypothetical protein
VDNFGLFDRLRFAKNIEQPFGLRSSLGKRKRSAPKGAPAYGGYAAPKKALRRLAPRKSAAQKGMQKRKGAGARKTASPELSRISAPSTPSRPENVPGGKF